MYYDVTVIEDPAYYEVAVKYNVSCGVMLASDTLCVTYESCCLQKDSVKAVTVSDTTCYVTVLLI